MDTLALLVQTATPPPFIYIHHPHHPTTSLEWPATIKGYRVDAIECHSPKMMWSAIISRLEGGDGGMVDSMDAFLRRLRAVGQEGTSTSTSRTTTANGSARSKGKGKEKELMNGHRNGSIQEVGMSVIITKAERLPKVFGQNWTVMTRLSELVGLKIKININGESRNDERSMLIMVGWYTSHRGLGV